MRTLVTMYELSKRTIANAFASIEAAAEAGVS